jgi:predicted SAM-dependent methyltransferase
MNIKYYPVNDDPNWNYEIAKILPYCDGLGLDIGCGDRTVNKGIKRLDIDPKVKPDICAPGDKTGLPPDSFDFVLSVHSLEHFEDQEKTIKEWLRVLKIKGRIIIIHPDVKYTKKQKEAKYNLSLFDNRYLKHWHERTYANFMAWIASRSAYGYRILAHGVALGNWSFYCVLEKYAHHY